MIAHATPTEFPDNILEQVPLTDIETIDKFSSRLIADLYKSCDQSKEQQLKAADALMERLYNIGYDNNRKKKLVPTHPIYKIGNDLYFVTKQIYAHKLAVNKCKDLVIEINNAIVDSNVNID